MAFFEAIRARLTMRGADAGERALAVLLSVATAGSVLAIGSVHLPVLVILSAIAFSAAAIAAYLRVAEGKGSPRLFTVPSLTSPGAILALLAVYTWLQAAPLPMDWLAAIAPQNADIWARALLPLGEAPKAWATISLDPGASLIEGLKWITYAAIFTAAAAMGARRGASWGSGVVFASAVLAALTTIGHGLLGATRVFGLYKPNFSAPAWHVGPLLNPNNLAGYLNLGAMCGIGLMLMRRPLVPPWLAGIGVAVVMAVEITSGSRGGVIALLLGIIAMAVFSWRSSRGSGSKEGASSRRTRILWLIGAVATGGAALAALGGTSETWAELYDKNLQKIEMLRWAAPLVREHAWLGVGRGAFESVFPAYKATPGNIVYTHAENFPMQWISEWGAPVGIAAMIAFARALSPGKVGAPRSAVATGVWVGFAVLLVQNLFDLALEIPAVCVALFVALGALWGDGRRRRLPRAEKRGPGDERRARLAAGLVASIGIAAIAAAVIGGARDLGSDRAEIREAYAKADMKSEAARVELRQELRAATLRHPAEPYFPLVGALVAWLGRDQEPMPWLQRTLEREPLNGRAHLLLADVLAGRGAKAQALLELRLATENDATLVANTAAAALKLTRAYEELLRAVPEGKAGAASLDELGVRLAAMGERVARSQCDREAIARDPTLVGPRMREADELIRALTKGSRLNLCADRGWCEREIEAHAAAIALSRPRSSLPTQLRARKLLAEGRIDDAEKMLQTECGRATDRADCLRLRVDTAAQVKAPDRLALAIKDFLAASCARALSCADAATWAANVRADRGEWGAAVALYARAAREDATEERLLRLADAAARSGAHAEAADALERVGQKRGGADPELRRKIDEQRSLAAGVLIKP